MKKDDNSFYIGMIVGAIVSLMGFMSAMLVMNLN